MKLNARHFLMVLALVSFGAMAAGVARAQTTSEVYGFVMTDVVVNSEAVDPSWFDVQRPTKLPTVENGFGATPSVQFSARQSRFGVRSTTATGMGDLKTTFEWELFGVGVDAGQTTIRLRHAYGELGQFGAGQTWSPFMDIDVFPNSVEYWGPNGMVFFRNVQVRWMPVQGDDRVTIALERPGASGDQGLYGGDAVLDDVSPVFPVPDLSGEIHKATGFGYVEVAGILRKMEWNDDGTDAFDLEGDAIGWGLNLSTNIKAGANTTARLQYVFGEGIQNYMNDAPADIGIETNPGSVVTPIQGVALPITGLVAFIDHNWNEKFSSTVGYSRVDIDNSDGQTADAFKVGQYALANLMYMPVPKVMLGGEVGWIGRENNSDGVETENLHLQFSFKYSFSSMLGGGQ